MTTGAYSKAEIQNAEDVKSKNAIAAAFGYDNRARAPLGCWLVLSEWNEQGDKILRMATAQVDGKKVKADTWYRLRRGRLVRCK